MEDSSNICSYIYFFYKYLSLKVLLNNDIIYRFKKKQKTHKHASCNLF